MGATTTRLRGTWTKGCTPLHQRGTPCRPLPRAAACHQGQGSSPAETFARFQCRANCKVGCTRNEPLLTTLSLTQLQRMNTLEPQHACMEEAHRCLVFDDDIACKSRWHWPWGRRCLHLLVELLLLRDAHSPHPARQRAPRPVNPPHACAPPSLHVSSLSTTFMEACLSLRQLRSCCAEPRCMQRRHGLGLCLPNSLHNYPFTTTSDLNGCRSMKLDGFGME